jgi:hypothetical protein
MLATTLGIDSENGLIHNPSVNSRTTKRHQNLPELALIEGNQRVPTKFGESLSPSLFTFRSHFSSIDHN